MILRAATKTDHVTALYFQCSECGWLVTFLKGELYDGDAPECPSCAAEEKMP